jgi:lambda repressor-like predicted transcriptional regulator
MKRKTHRKLRSAKRKPKAKSRKQNRTNKLTSQRVTSAISKMREQGISLRKAAREAKVSPRTVIKNAASALSKKKSGRYAAKASDRLVRSLMIPTPEGPEPIEVRGLSAASLLGRYWASLHRFYERGDDSSLQKFRGKVITSVGGQKYPLLTDLEILNRVGSAGVVSSESLYSHS